MSTKPSSLLSCYVPGVSGQPGRLAWKLLRDPNPAARAALFMAVGGLFMAPLDRLLSAVEPRRIRSGARPEHPVILVCGPPRSGTTLLAHYLVDTLETDYLSNLTSLFPRSPLSIRHLAARCLPDRAIDYDAFYGRSRGLSGINDALYLWDRWLGADRSAVPDSLLDGSADALPAFFAALQSQTDLPTVNKVNRVVTCADHVAEVLPEARFICLRRDPVQLAQSLLVARESIVGDMSRPYGQRHENAIADDPVEDVCRQVEFYRDHTERLQKALGKERFAVLEYETFCRQPREQCDAVLCSLGITLARRSLHTTPAAFVIAPSKPLPVDVIQRLEERLAAGEPL